MHSLLQSSNHPQSANVSKDQLTSWAINKISMFRAKALRLELAVETNSRRRAFARNVEVLFIAWVVSRSIDTFASCDNVVRNRLGQACYTADS